LQGTGGFDGAVLGAYSFLLRFFAPDADRLLLINLDVGRALGACPEPLLAPPDNMQWRLLWSSEDPNYGGHGTPLGIKENWMVPGYSALVLASEKISDESS
jgi:maltooligosyltrehalose trehalohydrolase